MATPKHSDLSLYVPPHVLYQLRKSLADTHSDSLSTSEPCNTPSRSATPTPHGSSSDMVTPDAAADDCDNIHFSEMSGIIDGLASESLAERQKAKALLEELDFKEKVHKEMAPLQRELQRLRNKGIEMETSVKRMEEERAGHIAWMERIGKEVEEMTDRLRNELQTTGEKLAISEAEANMLKAQLRLSPTNATTSPSDHRSPIFPGPDPATDSGLEIFLAKMKWKFMHNADHFDTEQHKLAYAISKTPTKIQRGLIQRYVRRDGSIDIADVDELTMILEEVDLIRKWPTLG